MTKGRLHYIAQDLELFTLEGALAALLEYEAGELLAKYAAFERWCVSAPRAPK